MRTSTAHQDLSRMLRGLLVVNVCTILAVMFTSDALDLELLNGGLARLFMAAYIGLMVVLIVRPWPGGHLLGIFFAAVVFSGRTSAFVRIVLVDDRPDLWGTVAERVDLMFAFIFAHTVGMVLLRREPIEP